MRLWAEEKNLGGSSLHSMKSRLKNNDKITASIWFCLSFIYLRCSEMTIGTPKFSIPWIEITFLYVAHLCLCIWNIHVRSLSEYLVSKPTNHMEMCQILFIEFRFSKEKNLYHEYVLPRFTPKYPNPKYPSRKYPSPKYPKSQNTHVFLFKVVFCKYFDLWYFNLIPPIFWSIIKPT